MIASGVVVEVVPEVVVAVMESAGFVFVDWLMLADSTLYPDGGGRCGGDDAIAASM